MTEASNNKPLKKRRATGQDGVMLLEMVVAAFFIGAAALAVMSVMRVPLQVNALKSASDAVDAGDGLRRAWTRDFQGAVRDSIRITRAQDGRMLAEFVPQTGSGIYMQTNAASSGTPSCESSGKGDALAIGESDSCFKSDGVAGLSGVSTGMRISLPGMGSASYYSGGASSITGITLGSRDARISIAQTTFPTKSAGSVFQVGAASPVTWECDTSKGTITRITGYQSGASQPVSFDGATRKTYAQGVTACSFRIGDSSEWARTVLLMHFDGSGTSFADSSPDPKSIAYTGSAIQSTEAAWLGDAGGRFAGGRVSATWSSAMEPGSSDWTVDLRVRGGGQGSGALVMSEPAGGGYGPVALIRGGDGVVRFYSSSNGTSWNVAQGVSMGSGASEVFRHFAATRSGSTIYLFRDGALMATVPVSGALASGNGGFVVGSAADGSSPFTGDLDEVRVLIGRAAWTQAFDPPAKAYSKPDDAFVASATVKVNDAPSLVTVAVEPRNGNN